MRSNKNIEETATTFLKSVLLRCDQLDPRIDNNDKTPSWDGEVIVHPDSSDKKVSIARVPVQVKGKVVQSLPDKSTKFSVGITDLDNYRRDGGILYFVVYQDVCGENCRIFYSKLMPYDIALILRGIREKAKTVTITLEPFPEHDTVAIMNLFFAFIIDKPKQMGIIGSKVRTISELEKSGVELDAIRFYVPRYSICSEDYAALSMQDFYLYGRVKGLDIDFPIERVTDSYISKPMAAPVSVNGCTFYSAYTIIYHRGKPTIRIGNSLLIKGFENSKPKFEFTLQGTLKERLIDLSFMLAALRAHKIEINGGEIVFSQYPQSDYDNLDRLHARLRELAALFQELGVNEELDFSLLTDRDEKSIRDLVGAIVYGTHIGFEGQTKEVFYGRYPIANLHLLLWAERDEAGLYVVENFGKRDTIHLAKNESKENTQNIAISKYLLLFSGHYAHISNFDYDAAFESITSAPPPEDDQGTVTLCMLEMLKAYDAQEKKDEKLLRLAERISRWLCDQARTEHYDTDLLNYFQIAKRYRELTVDEIGELYRIRNADDPTYRCAANLLLGDVAAAVCALDELQAGEEKEYFLSQPIMVFMPDRITKG